MIRVVEKDLLTQSENFKKKLAERKKLKLISMSMNQSLNSSLSLNFTGLKQRQEMQVIQDSTKATHHQALSGRMNSAFEGGVPAVGQSMLGDNSFFGITPTGTPGGHADGGATSKGGDTLGISRVDAKIMNDFNDEDEEEDLTDLIQLIAELNAH